MIPAIRPSPARDAAAASHTHLWRIARPVFIAAFTYVFLANAWLGDDAYITFRVIWNVLHGYGLVFNPGERVQAYTHPLWMLLMTGAHALTREFFFTSLAVSYACALAAILVVVRSTREIGVGAVAFLWLLSSKAFVDYTSSGLEYPLSYLLLALFYVRFCAISDAPLTDKDLRRFGVLAGLSFVNRLDSVLLFAPALAWLALRAIRRRHERVLPLLIGFGVPAIAWLIFATAYYGFPLPNTYYAKVATGIPASLLYRQGWAYLLNSFAHDPITLATVGVAAALAIRSWLPRGAAFGTALPITLAVTGSALYVGYTISVGGDFMSGRFFAMPFLVAVIAILQVWKGSENAPTLITPVPYQAAAAAALVVYNLLMPLAPVKTTASYDAAWPWRSQNGIKDERGHYHRITNPFFYSPFRQLPDHTWMREGLSFRNGPEKVTVQGSIGYFGLAAGPDKYVIDRNALSDPLLARLPVSPRLYFEFFIGHYFRDIPEGYPESVASGANHIVDPVLHEYYDQLRVALQGPLFSMARIRSLWRLNLGADRDIASRFETRRPVALSIRAANERFLVDAGERDATAGVIRSVGRPGYLQYGPGVPMKAGAYRARWVGTLQASAATGSAQSIGFVDVWAGDQRLAKRDISAAEVQADRHELAAIDFVLQKPTNHLEYRLWIDGHTPVVLERVELFSTGAQRIP